MECEYAVRRQGARVLDCEILKRSGGKWCACGHQRYCPAKQSVILTESAKNCTVRKRKARETDSSLRSE